MAKSVDIPARLKDLRDIVTQISKGITTASSVTVGELLKLVHQSGLLILDPRLISYLDPTMPTTPTTAEQSEGETEDNDGEKEMASMDAFLACPANQLLAYYNYISEQSPFWTQQGVKGAEFKRVLVVLDDAESTHFQFSYEKYFGLKALSDTDLKHIEANEETVVDRTRRLFYVSCTRALKDLAVVLFTANPSAAKTHILTLGLFEDDEVHTQDIIAEA